MNPRYWLKQLGEKRYPKEWKCHIRTGLNSTLLTDVRQPILGVAQAGGR